MKVHSALSMHTVAAVIVPAARFHLGPCLLSGALILIRQLCLCMWCELNSHVSAQCLCRDRCRVCFFLIHVIHTSASACTFSGQTQFFECLFCAAHLGRILCTGLLGLFQEYHAVVASWQDVARELQGGARQESWIWTSKLLCHGRICGEQREECRV